MVATLLVCGVTACGDVGTSRLTTVIRHVPILVQRGPTHGGLSPCVLWGMGGGEVEAHGAGVGILVINNVNMYNKKCNTVCEPFQRTN